MTYCVAMRLEQGMIFAADSRTNAGVDQIATFRKLHRFEREGERLIVLLSAGNLATTQSVLSLLRSRAADDTVPNIYNAKDLYEVAGQVGATVREVIDQSRAVTNREVPHVIGPRRAGDATKLVSGSSRAERELGWKPARSDMRTMIADAWRWHETGHYDK